MLERQTDKVKLRFIELDDTDNIVKWRNKPFVKNNLFTQEDLTPEQHINYFNSRIITGDIKQFIILALNKGEYQAIGTTFLKNIDNHSKKAEFGIFIGDETAIGKKYGSLAVKLTIQYAFRKLNLNRVWLTVFSDNISAIRAYKKNGFEIEGVLKQDFFKNGIYIDVVVMGLLKEKWEDFICNESNQSNKSPD